VRRPKRGSGERDLYVVTRTDYSRRGAGDGNLWSSTRASKSAAFQAPESLLDLNTSFDDARAFVLPGGLVMYIISGRGGYDRDIGHADRPEPDAPFSTLQNLTALNGPDDEADVHLSSDAEEIFFVVSASGETTLYRALADCP
jgi:hypothetical protein